MIYHVLLVFGHCGRGHQDIVQVDEQMRDAGQDVIHEPLEGLAHILQPEGHPPKLPQPKRSDEGRFRHVSGHYLDCGEDLHPLQLGRQVLNVWWRQGWEFAHLISEQIAHFLSKNEQIVIH